jgi:Holliday junction resolvasome RuvABC endonuclease subunit
MMILGIDPGTHCGWALFFKGHPHGSGVWDLRPRRHEGGGMRFLRLRTYLEEILAASRSIDAIAYEEVRRHMGVDAAHIYGGIVGVIGAFCEEHKIPYRGIPVGTIKKYATGKGNAKKDAMIAAAEARFGITVADDNEADALFIARFLDHELNGERR